MWKEADEVVTGEQIKNSVKAYADGNGEKFKTIALQIVAHEARIGHDSLARELKKQLDRVGNKKSNIVQLTSVNPIFTFSMPSHKLEWLIVSDNIKEKIERILNEYRNRHKLALYG